MPLAALAMTSALAQGTDQSVRAPANRTAAGRPPTNAEMVVNAFVNDNKRYFIGNDGGPRFRVHEGVFDQRVLGGPKPVQVGPDGILGWGVCVRLRVVSWHEGPTLQTMRTDESRVKALLVWRDGQGVAAFYDDNPKETTQVRDGCEFLTRKAR